MEGRRPARPPRPSRVASRERRAQLVPPPARPGAVPWVTPGRDRHPRAETASGRGRAAGRPSRPGASRARRRPSLATVPGRGRPAPQRADRGPVVSVTPVADARPIPSVPISDGIRRAPVPAALPLACGVTRGRQVRRRQRRLVSPVGSGNRSVRVLANRLNHRRPETLKIASERTNAAAAATGPRQRQPRAIPWPRERRPRRPAPPRACPEGWHSCSGTRECPGWAPGRRSAYRRRASGRGARRRLPGARER